MTEEPEDIGEQLRKALRRLTWATVVVYLFLTAAIVAGYIVSSGQRSDLRATALSANSALCTLRSDLELRIEDARIFLDEHPDGIPGIPAATLVQSIANQKRTIDALSSLQC
jgi:hypothetical protein